MRPLAGATALLLSTTCLAVQAQAIYRCGDSYSQQPCAGGQPLPQALAPNPADRTQAGANARRDATLAATLEKDRLRQEGQAGTPPLYIPPPADTAFEEHRSPEKNATRKLDVFTASAPGSAKKQGKDKKAKAAAKSDGKAKVAKAPATPAPRTFQVGKPAKAGDRT